MRHIKHLAMGLIHIIRSQVYDALSRYQYFIVVILPTDFSRGRA